jgi:K+-sensing histidine kinase KdpD
MTSTDTKKVLIVEDNQENTDLLVFFLKPKGYQITTVTDGQQALDAVEKDKPDIILLDIMLPKVNGFEVCQKLKSDKTTVSIPILMITALKELKDKIKALEVGADDFISKPFENVELLARVKSLLRLKEYHDQLEQKNVELEEKNKTLIRMDEFKEELINLIVHDMKNPLFVIQGNLQMMSMNIDQSPTETIKKYTKRIERSSQQLLRMVVNLLDISRFEEGNLVLKQDMASINSIIEEITQRIKEYPENKTKEVIFDAATSMPEVVLDKSIMERVIENMVNFAINNTADGGRVDIQTRILDDAQLQFSIHDTGTQIPKKFHDKIFEKFSQAEIKNAGHRVERALGLTFCKMAIDAHNGKMWMDLDNPVGNRFVIQLPLKTDLV